VFTPEERERIRERVFEVARADSRITGGATTGSRSVGQEDEWSDVDTAFGVAEGVAPDEVLRDWTELFERELDVVHRFDLRRGSTVYRVFLLANALEVDVSLTPAAEFGAHGPSFRLEFGESEPQAHTAPPELDEQIGWGWIYVLIARAAIERGRLWEAEYWISSVRDQGLALACVRHGLPPAYNRAAHRLDPSLAASWEEALVHSLEPEELRRALDAAARELLREVGEVRPELAERLREVFSE
jgi:hypothetical protein